MLRSVALFSDKATDSDLQPVIEGCRKLIRSTSKMSVDLENLPDLLMVAKNEKDEVVGLVSLFYTGGTKAWKVGTIAVCKDIRPELVTKFLLDGACSAIRIKCVGLQRAWMVQKVKLTNSRNIAWLNTLGFSLQERWQDNFLSDDGFIPFDPFEEILMKKSIFSE